MVREAVYSYTIFKDYWKPLDESFYNVAKLSIRLAKMHYKTVLYCDSNTRRIFNNNGLHFDSYVVQDSWFAGIDRTTSGKPKILAALDQTAPYILLDLDTLIFSNLYSSKSVAYGFKEASNGEDYDLDYIDKFYRKSYNVIKDRLDFRLEWRNYPNNSLVIVNNPSIVRMGYEYVEKVMEGNFKNTSAMFYEQFLLYNFLLHHNTPIEFLYDKPPVYLEDSNNTIAHIMSKQFAHLGDYNHTRQMEIVKEITNFLDKIVA